MKLTIRTSSVRTIRYASPGFMLNDGLTMIPRAGFEISEKCPKEYRSVIQECIMNNWLMPVAHVKDSELFWEAFSK